MLTIRQRQLLDFIVREYVQSAEPVGSALVSEQGGFEISSATIRNEMQILENLGYLMQPHTSAGRVPTDKAYRLFVNSLLEQATPDPSLKDKRKIQETIAETGDDPREINKTVARLLSDLSDSIVITNSSESDDFYKTGLSSLLNFPEFREFHRITNLMEFFDQFDRLFDQLERQFLVQRDLNQGIRIFIGRENTLESIRDETIICAQYRLPHDRTGLVTVIGPTRMNYPRNIGLVTYMSYVLNKKAEQEHE